MRDATWRACKRCGGTLNVPPENTRSQRIEGERLRECAQRIEVRQDIWIYDWHPRVHLVLAEVTVLYALVLGCVAGIAQAPASRRDQGPEAWLEAQGSGWGVGRLEVWGSGTHLAPGSWFAAGQAEHDRHRRAVRRRSELGPVGTAVCAPHGSRVARHDLRG